MSCDCLLACNSLWSCVRTSIGFVGGAAAFVCAYPTNHHPYWLIAGAISAFISSTIFKPTMKSYFNDELVLDNHKWAITLINTGEKTFGHSMIVVEGIYLESPRRIFYDLVNHDNGPEIRCGKYVRREYNGKHAWVTTIDKIREMERNINREIKKGVSFHVLGNESFFNPNKSHNCATWAKEKLEILGINLPPDGIGWFGTRPVC